MNGLKIGKDVAAWNEVFEKLKKYNPKHDGPDSTIVVSKKNTFRMEVNVVCHHTTSVYGQLWLRTSKGGYAYQRHVRDLPNIIASIEHYMEQDPVEKTEITLNKNQFFANILARKILPSLGTNAKITRLATSETDECVMFGSTVERVRVSKERVMVHWRLPDGCMRQSILRYDIANPNFDPDKLVKLITRFVKEAVYVGSSLGRAWNDVESEWNKR